MLVWSVKHFSRVCVWMLTFFNNNRIYYVLCELEVFFHVLFMFSYDLEFTVAHNLVAVSTGSLLYQVEMNDIKCPEI